MCVCVCVCDTVSVCESVWVCVSVYVSVCVSVCVRKRNISNEYLNYLLKFSLTSRRRTATIKLSYLKHLANTFGWQKMNSNKITKLVLFLEFSNSWPLHFIPKSWANAHSIRLLLLVFLVRIRLNSSRIFRYQQETGFERHLHCT